MSAAARIRTKTPRSTAAAAAGKPARRQPPKAKPAAGAAPARGAKTTTVRLAPESLAAVELLRSASKGKTMPLNKIVNQALIEFVDRGVARLKFDAEETLRRLTTYRKSDPGFRRAMVQFVDAEARHGATDPMEGTLIETPAGPALKMVRELLRG